MDPDLHHTNSDRNYWKEEEESIIKQWADKALCYQWMHARCREIFQSQNAWFTIPVIIISTITGTANFAQDRFSDGIKDYAVVTIGTLSIIAGIITTIYNFLQISELNEGHRVATLSWGKYHNNLKTELARHPLDRIDSKMAVKIYSEEYDRLIEVSPEIIKSILELFNKKFKRNDLLIKPDICNKLNGTTIYEITDVERMNMIQDINHDTSSKKNKSVFDLDDYDLSKDMFVERTTDENSVVSTV